MLESYVTPLLMSYVNRYIKNLKPSDLQLSLWGGDVVLSKLDLKLDVLEQELKLPFTFLSGHIHELRIHVPWTKLGSEPVVITINTMECILKLKDGVQDENESSASSRSASEKSVSKPRRVQQSPTDPDLPPGYVQSLIRRVVNNVNVVVNNLILKYVEDDIVLSVNITSAECYTVDELWDRAFMDITSPELVLRKVINFADCTVCLDKRNASGKIEFYQDPLLYKCSFKTRLHFTYHNINSKIPAVIKIQTMVESLKLSLTDQQLPMFVRVLELAVALYYGEIGAYRDGEREESVSGTEAVVSIPSTVGEGVDPAVSGQYLSPDQYVQKEDEEQGWVSWAWSFVPAIVSSGEEEGEAGFYMDTEDGGTPSPLQPSFREPIVSVGFYCTKASVTFKLTEGSSDSSYYSPQKVKSQEVLCVEQEGITVEALMMGELFFDCQIGVVGCRALCLKGIMGVRDFEDNMGRKEEDAVFFNCGESLRSKGMTYLTNSLFDYRSPENNGVHAEFILDGNLHKETYTEAAGMHRFGAFYMDYLYMMEKASGKGLQDFSAVGKVDPAPLVQETSVKRLVIGPLDLQLHSSAVHRILKMIACAMDHEYEPYCKHKPSVVEESRVVPGEEEVAVLEEFIPTRLTCLTLLKASITVAMAEFNLLHMLVPAILGQKCSTLQMSAPQYQPVRPLPAFRLQVERVNLEHSVPMYGLELIRTVSSLSQPSDNLLHHCYTHCYLKVFELQAGLTLLDNEGTPPLLHIIPAFSTALYGKILQLPMYWSKRSSVSITECMFELPHFTVQATHPQMLLLNYVWQSWTHSTGSGAGPTTSDTLISEVYRSPGGKRVSIAPTLEVLVQSVELKLCQRTTVWCASGTVGAIKVCAKTLGICEEQREQLVVVLQGPSDTQELYSRQWLNESRRPQSLLAPDLLTFSLQIPQPIGDCRNSGAVMLVSVQGIAVNVDPVLSTWLLHQPQRPSASRQTQQTVPIVKMMRREDEASVGSTPLAKQLSNQASDYASSPVKTKTVTESRPLSIPMKVMQSSPECSVSSEERMKELIIRSWDAVKRLTLQVELQSCCVFVPNDTLPCPSTIVCGDIPGTVRSWYHNQASMPGTLVVCLPQISVLSVGHRHMEPLQEIPFTIPRPVLEEGDAFPWTVTVGQFSMYTLLGHQRSLSLLEPIGCTSTLAVTSHKLQPGPTTGFITPDFRHAFIICLHVDLQPLHLKLSNPQVQLLYELFLSWSRIWEHLQRRQFLRQASNFPDPAHQPAGPPSPLHSSADTVPPDTSTLSPSADLGSPTEGDSLPAGEDPVFCEAVTLEQKTNNIGGTSGKVSLWMQWMLPKLTVKLFSLDPTTKTEICVIGELEDLSASVDMQDVYTKVKCKVGSFNIDHYRSSGEAAALRPGVCGGVLLSCTDKLNRRTVLLRPASRHDPFSHFSAFFPPTAAKALEVCHQPHGFLSVTYTQAVTRNVRHKLTTRQERGTGPLKLSEGGADGSPQHLHEILLTAQPFDLVLSYPLLANVAQVFCTVPPPPCRRPDPKCNSDSWHKEKKEDTLVLKIGSVSMAPQADNPLNRTILRKDIYQRAMNMGVLRDPGSEVEDRQYQINLQSISVGTALWEQLQPEREGTKGGSAADGERSSQNPALEWNMASSIRRHHERRAILTPILTDFSIRVTAAPAIIYSKPLSPDSNSAEEIVVCGHSLEVNVTSGLEMFLSVSQVQLIQLLLQANVGTVDTSEKITEMHRQDPQEGGVCAASVVELLGKGSVYGQDSGFGSDSACLRIIQIDQQSGTSHHRIARHSHQPSITKNLSFIPFDIFLTAGRLTLMTYSMACVPKPPRETIGCTGKSALSVPKEHTDACTPDQSPRLISDLSTLTAEDLLNGNGSIGERHPAGTGILSLERLSSPSRTSARHALGVTVVRQPGRRGVGEGLLQPFFFLQLAQPSALLSCHQRRQRLELSLFDVTLKGVTNNYTCLDAGKSLPESLDYSVFWLQTVAGEADSRTGIPPPLLSLCIRDFLSGPAEMKVTLCRPLKVNPTLAKLEQIKSFWRKIFAEGSYTPDTTFCTLQPSASSIHTPSHSAKQDERTTVSPSIPSQLAGALQTLAPFHKISLQTVQMVVVMETESHPSRPSLTFSVCSVTGSLNMKSGQKPLESMKEARVFLQCEHMLVRTALQERSRVFVGPFSCSVELDARWCRHSGSPTPEVGPPRILLDIKGGLLQVFWGQEHYNCLTLIQEYLQCYLKEVGGQVEKPVGGQEEKPKEKPFRSYPPPSPGPHSPCTEHSSDDLRTGLFQYIQDSASQKLPVAHEVVFYNETEDSPGVMMWRYPEPRVLTFVRITPVPFNTTEDPEISTADLGDILQVPCTLEFWDELKRAFVPYREFSLSECSVCELTLPPLSPHTHQTELVASDLWRVIVNSTGDGADESLDSESGSQLPCEQLVSPTALAACTRVDSCFAPWFVPSVGMSLRLAHLELRLCHHLEQLGAVPSQQLRPFLPDRKLPSDQEYGMVSVREPQLFVRQWSNGAQLGQELHFSTTLNCHLVDYRNLTLLPLLQPFSFQGHSISTYSQSNQRHTQLTLHVDPILVSLGQHAIHTLDTALLAWQQNLNPEAEELLFSHYVICNDTQETLRFGQVDTDESVVLASKHSHQYCWRSHKSLQLLHICIEGWGNWRWSEPFSIDNVGTLLRSIQRKGQTASLIIKVLPLSGVLKQIIICGRQVVCSYLSDAIEVRLVQHSVGLEGQMQVCKLQACVEPQSKLPSYVLDDSEVTELSVRLHGHEEWSQDICLKGIDENSSHVLQIPSSADSVVCVWCSIITLEPSSHMQQRLMVFSPLFVMRSHLPEAVLVHVEKRSLGQRESQLIPGQGQEQALLNVKPDITHHLTFQASEEGDASQCAVPISSALIRQIVNKANQEERQNHSSILEHFYGPKNSSQLPWPYTYKDTDRLDIESSVAQWDSPMQVRLCAWRTGLSTLLVELLPWALLSNNSNWDLWLFEAESIILQIPAGKTIIPPNFKEAFQIGLYWPHTNTVHKSAAIQLLHELTSPRWREMVGVEVLSLDEEGYVEAAITLGAPPRQKMCQFCVSSTVRHGIQVLQIEDRTVLVNNTKYTINYRPLLSENTLVTSDQPYSSPETSVFTLEPMAETGSPSHCAVPCWDVLCDGPTADLGSLPQKYILFSCLVASKQEGEFWSLPTSVRSDFPRQSVSVPVHQNAHNYFSTRALVLTYQEHLGINYISVSEDPCPRMLIHNRCPKALLLKENLREPARTEVFCRKLPPLSSVHHELYYHSSSFPECRQRETFPTLLLCSAPDLHSSPSATATTPNWTDAIDINSPGTQVMLLSGFGCLYVDVAHQSGTIILTLTPESCAGTVISEYHRVSDHMLSFRVLLNDVSVVLCDDITSPAGSVELLRLTASKILVLLPPTETTTGDTTPSFARQMQVLCGNLQMDNQLYSRCSFHFPVLLCQEQRADAHCWVGHCDPAVSYKALEDFQQSCFLCVFLTLSSNGFQLEKLSFQLKPARIYLEDTFVYYLKTLFHTYIPVSTLPNAVGSGVLREPGPLLPEKVYQSMQALVQPIRLQQLLIEPVSLLVSIHASLKLYIASDHTPLSFSRFEREQFCTTPRQLIHALTMHYAAGALFRAGWVVGSLEILGSPASLVRSIGNGVADFFRLPYEGLTRGPGAFVSGVSRGTSSFVRHISKGTLTSITNLATSLARNMDRLSLDEEHYTRQEEWRRQLPESLGHGLRQGLSRLGISLLGAIAGIVDQPMQTFTRPVEAHSTAASTARDVISGVGKGIVGVFTKPIGGAAELVSQTGYGILHGAGLWQLPKQLYPPTEEKAEDARNSHLKYAWKMLQSLGWPEVHMALHVFMVSSSGQEHAGCLLLSEEVLFIVSVCEDTQQQAFPITEVQCQQDVLKPEKLTLTLHQHQITSDSEGEGVRERLSEQQYSRLVDYVTQVSQYLAPFPSSILQHTFITAAEPPSSITKAYHYCTDPAYARVFIGKFNMVKNKALHVGFN
ncbi:vacuolar protein sorting-associated protein 13B isoform X3 [Pygocentrus nattereri]|uniref:vacuolar protein sorting-associated protein 13B isoform X3 n=1 Tax=Pygocentrus nattereri TaxID=42514 RepID=UPI001891E8FD|nr:vacuolar protein sorting-associated protein 13B isoform X3 [Pygocentrus nattereri]